MKRIATLLLLLFPTAAFAQVTYTWNGGSGNWGTAANWTPSGVPGSGDTALITADGDYTVTLNVDAEVDALTLGSGGTGTQMLTAGAGRTLTLNGDGVIATTGRLQLNNATLDGTGHLASAGRLDLWGSTANTAVTNLQGAALDVQRTSALNGAFLNQGFCHLVGSWFASNHAELTVAEGFINEGTIQLNGDHSGTVFGRATLVVTTGTLLNEGLIRTASSIPNALEDDRHYLRADLDNAGELHVQGRTLEVVQPSAQHVNDQRITIEEDMILLLSEGAFRFGPDAEVTGPGTLQIGENADVTFEDGAACAARLDMRTFTPGLTVLGVLSPASARLDPNSMGHLTFGLGGPPASSAYGQIASTGTVTVSRQLTLTLESGFIPQVGDVYTVVSGASISGTFDPDVDTPPGLEVTLAQNDTTITVTVTATPVANEPDPDRPMASTLQAPAPNPFTARTTLAYVLVQPGRVRLTLYDVLGRELAVLVDREHAMGRHEMTLDGRRLAPGFYLVRLVGEDGFAQTQRLRRLR